MSVISLSAYNLLLGPPLSQAKRTAASNLTPQPNMSAHSEILSDTQCDTSRAPALVGGNGTQGHVFDEVLDFGATRRQQLPDDFLISHAGGQPTVLPVVGVVHSASGRGRIAPLLAVVYCLCILSGACASCQAHSASDICMGSL